MKIEGLTKKYRNTVIFDNVNIELDDHQIVFLMGANGVGKTTLLKCILNLEKYDGTIALNAHGESAPEEISVLYDGAPLYLDLTGYQNISILVHRKIDQSQLNEVCSYLLDENILRKRVKHYSYGQRKKLSILICMLNRPKYIFMDEVASGLDYESMLKLKKLFTTWANDSFVFLTGQNFDFYDDVIDTLLVIKDQKIIVHDTEYKGRSDREELAKIYEKYYQID